MLRRGLFLLGIGLDCELALRALIGAGDSHGELCRRAEAFEQRLLIVGLVKHFVILRKDIFLILFEHKRQKFRKLRHIFLPVDMRHLRIAILKLYYYRQKVHSGQDFLYLLTSSAALDKIV